MSNEPELGTDQLDPAAIFACALSVREACLKSAKANPQLNLSECYNGMDQFLREMMRVANLFEAWACEHVAFEQTSEVWPYLMEDKFGDTCLESILPSALAEFDDSDCLRVALRLRLPIRTGAETGGPAGGAVAAGAGMNSRGLAENSRGSRSAATIPRGSLPAATPSAGCD